MSAEGQMSDHTGAKIPYPSLPPAKTLIAGKGYDSDEFSDALVAKKIGPCIPPKKNTTIQHDYDKGLHTVRHRIENMIGKPKDWRRIETRYDRCAHTFLSAICVAAAFIFHLNQ